MFSPHCHTCETKILLGTRRIVRVEVVAGGRRVHLRCFCGDLVVDDLTSDAAGCRELMGAA